MTPPGAEQKCAKSEKKEVRALVREMKREKGCQEL